MHAALLLGADRTVRSWEFEALRLAVAAGLQVTTILHSTNDPRPPLRPEHAAYYGLELASQMNHSMRRSDITSLLSDDVCVIRFESDWRNGRQHLPAYVTDQLDDVGVVVKFGTNQLGNPQSILSTHGVISYQYGSYDQLGEYPAGFHELDQGEAVMGVMIQQRSHSCDTSRILAKAYSRVVPTSYKTTLEDAKVLGAPLLAQAIAALSTNDVGETVVLASERRLPRNGQVLGVLGKMARARMGRLLYGGFKEKRWNIAFVPGQFDPETTMEPDVTELHSIQPPPGYTFAADPCGSHKGRLYVELMHASRGKGEIFMYGNGTWQPVEVPVDGGHLSYPQVVKDNGDAYLFPESAEVGPPTLYPLDETGTRCSSGSVLAGLEDQRIVDGTLLEHNNRWYLFGSPLDAANARLDLWVANDLTGPWSLHPSSPVCLDPRSARMGGPIIQANDRLYRVGQDGSISYGRGTTLHRIEKLTPDHYQEVACRPFAIQGAHGPHTILVTENGYWLDYYTEKTTPMAGARRLKGLLL